MNLKLLTSKIIDFILNLAVVSVGLAIFEQNWLGLLVGFIALTIAFTLILKTKE